jgi:hypothetical protein
MTKTPQTDPEIAALMEHLTKTGHGGLDLINDAEVVEDAPVKSQLISALVKEFKCLPCGRPFSREDCGSDAKGVFAAIRRCPFCRSETVVRQIESNWAAERKYDVDPAEAILGAKPNKYARMNAAKKRRGH